MATETLPPVPAPAPVLVPSPQEPEPVKKPKGDFLLTFPPFPPPPEGVKILPFKEFKERGIRVDPGPDDEEVDGLGTPTVPMIIRHNTDVCKSNTSRKRKAAEQLARKRDGLPFKKLPWYEEWEETEVIRFAIGFNPNSSGADRLLAAANDFTTGRKWPANYASETGPKYIWEKFQRYIGLTVLVPEGKKSKKKKQKIALQMMENVDPSDDELEMEEEMKIPAGANADALMDEPEEDEEEETPAVFLDKQLSAQKSLADSELKTQNFLDDPDRSIRIFMSSYARTMGYIWSDVNNNCLARVLDFFIKFLIRSKVLPEIERPLRRSLESIASGIKELPNNSKVAKVLPDQFHSGCSGCWGKREKSYFTIAVGPLSDDEGSPEDKPAENAQAAETDAASDGKGETTWGSTEPGTGWGAAASGEAGVGWGTSNDTTNGWGSGQIEGWDAAEPLIVDASDTAQQSTFEEQVEWEPVQVPSLTTFLGPTAFPLTHTPGVVERSMRRVKAIIPPSSNPPKSSPQADEAYEPDADAVEVELDKLFAKVVLEPMPLNWDVNEDTSYGQPTIIDGDALEQDRDLAPPAQATADAANGAGPKQHDPLTDEITLLVEPEHSSLLSVGMALGGTYVQIARQSGAAKKKKKGKSKSKRTIPNYWYLENLIEVLPTFWTIDSA
ncbi:hypothetical protein CPC08DRAFT_817118 [Agrocybe pediades]|nr:hypothetical protein CPC08DRAFT_817118 [Agrocybe pediades]